MNKLLKALQEGISPMDVVLNKKDQQAPEAAPMIAPKPPVEEASVQIEDPKKKKVKTGKASLKMPLSTSQDTGLKI